MEEKKKVPMMAVVQDIILDVNKPEELVRVSVKKGDANKCLWRFCLVDDGEPVNLRQTDTACIRILKPDGKKILNPCVIRDNVIEYTVTSQTVSVAGRLLCQVEVYHGHYDQKENMAEACVVGEKLATAVFGVNVLEQAFDDDLVDSESEYKELTKLESMMGALEQRFPVKESDICDDAVTTAKVAAGAITTNKLTDKAVTTAKISTGAVTTETIRSGNVTPEKTSFVFEKPSSQNIGGGFGLGEIDPVTGSIDYTKKLYYVTDVINVEANQSLYQYYVKSSDCLVYEYKDSVYQHTTATLEAVDYYEYRICFTNTDTNQIRVALPKDYPADVVIPYMKVDAPDDALLMPKLVVSSGNLGPGAVTLSKLNSDVMDMLSSKLKREIVPALPSAEGKLLAKRTAEVTEESKPNSNLLSTYWKPLDMAANLAPVTETKRIRMTVTLTCLDGESPGYHGGEIRLCHSSDRDAYVKYVKTDTILLQEGDNQLDISLADFRPLSSSIWSGINEITVFTYANSSSGSYAITVSNIRIVDTSVGIEPQTVYMIPSSNPETENVYDEFMYINGQWEQIGSTAMDLSGYATKDEMAQQIMSTDRIAPQAITTEKLADKAVTPEKTSFAEEEFVRQNLSYYSVDLATVDPVTGELDYTNKSNRTTSFISVDLSNRSATYYMDNEYCSVYEYKDGVYKGAASLEWVDYYKYKIVFTNNDTNQIRVSASANDSVMFLTPFLETQKIQVPHMVLSGKQIEDATITADKLASDAVNGRSIQNASITLSKLHSDVTDMLSGALKREIVQALPSSDGARLWEWNDSPVCRNLVGQENIIKTEWLKNGIGNLGNISKGRHIHLRFDVELACESGEERFTSGQVDIGNKTASIFNHKFSAGIFSAGTNHVDVALTSDTYGWNLTEIEGFKFFVYGAEKTGSYTMSVSNIRIVDIDQVDIDPHTIYLVPSSDPENQNVYDEYMYINYQWEQIGSTAVDLSAYVTSTDYATSSKAGIVKPIASYGLQMWGADNLGLTRASATDIENRDTNDLKPIVLGNMDAAVKAAMCDGKGTAWTANEQSAAIERMGLYTKTEIDEKLGDVETALDSIITMQTTLIGGETV